MQRAGAFLKTSTQVYLYIYKFRKMPVKTGIVLLNMGGPSLSKDSAKYLSNLFHDEEIIKIPMRKYFFTYRYLAPIISNLRGEKLAKKYDSIGGGSPILKWTQFQGEKMVEFLNRNLRSYGKKNSKRAIQILRRFSVRRAFYAGCFKFGIKVF